MSDDRGGLRADQRGSAMVVAVLVMAILTLLGMSFLLMADTENRMAENERLAASALYFAEGVTREVKRWFDRPPYGALGDRNLVRPTIDVLDRSLRSIDPDGPGPATAVAADGSAARPYYKAGVDRDADGNDDVFDRPYRAALADALSGTAAGPDLRIDRAAGGPAAAFLDALAERVMPGFPAGAAGIRARVATIDVYAPPSLDAGGGAWVRTGIATVGVRVQILKEGAPPGDDVLADRTVTAVLGETPLRGPFGPLHSCAELRWSGAFFPRWGTATAVGPDAVHGEIDVPDDWETALPEGIPRATPPLPRRDPVHGHDDAATWSALAAGLEGTRIADPWFRFLAGSPVADWSALPAPQLVVPGTAGVDRSNLFQSLPGVTCPSFDYDTWKRIARSGGSDVRYFAWDGGTRYRENGSGPAAEIEAITDGGTGLYFFDTTDGLPPHDEDASGVAANLTPPIRIARSGYGARGFLYVNSRKWTNGGAPGRPIAMHWPAEPFRDVNGNGARDAGEEWINLDYRTISTTDPSAGPVVSSTDDFGGGVVWNSRGPEITGQRALLWGLLYVAGDFDAEDTPLYYGSVITGAGNDGVLGGTPGLYWDTDLQERGTPAEWGLPRVVITRWQAGP